MLGKLMKHEFRATARTMLPMFLGMVLISILANLSVRVMDAVDNDVLSVIAGFILLIFGVGIIAVGVLALVVMIRRFHANVLTDEGYLTMTLPVSIHDVLWSKIIVSTVWFIASGLVIALSVLIMAFRVSIIAEIQEWFSGLFQQLTTYYALNGAALIAEVLLIIFLGCVATCLHFYASMATGYGFAAHKALLSVVFFFAFSFALEVLGTLATVLISKISIDLSPMAATHVVMFSLALAELIYGAVFYVITVWNLKRRLNLE